jgi:hypothetical protein
MLPRPEPSGSNPASWKTFGWRGRPGQDRVANHGLWIPKTQAHPAWLLAELLERRRRRERRSSRCDGQSQSAGPQAGVTPLEGFLLAEARIGGCDHPCGSRRSPAGSGRRWSQWCSRRHSRSSPSSFSRPTRPARADRRLRANWLIWGIFAVELAAILIVADRKWAALRAHWLDVAVVVLTVPLGRRETRE